MSLQDESVWSDREKSLTISKQKSFLEKELSEFNQISSDFSQLKEFKELYDEDQSLELTEYLNSEIKKINDPLVNLNTKFLKADVANTPTVGFTCTLSPLLCFAVCFCAKALCTAFRHNDF